MGWWPLLVLGWGCAAGSSADAQTLADQARYREAVLTTDAREAVRLCGQIGEARLRQECQVFAAGALLLAGGDAEAVCQGMETPEWQAVCFFELVDKGRLRGEPALVACQRTGVFRQRCVSHALQREERALAREFPPGQETEMMARIRSLVAQYGLDDAEEEALDVVMVGRLIAERKRQGAPQTPFSRADCGNAPDSACADAYRAFVYRAGGEGKVPADCSLPMDPARVSALGLPVWSADMQPLADSVWAQLCRRQKISTHKPPDFQNSQRAQDP